MLSFILTGLYVKFNIINSSKIAYCSICGRRHRMICLVLTRICSVFTGLYLPSRALEDNTVHINLRTGFVKGYSPYMSFIESPKAIPGNSCNKQVVLKIDFSGKYDGAKFTLLYGEPPTFWTLDISDSPTGDGYGGDNGTTSYMAELQIRNKQLRIYGNDLPGHMDASSNGGLLIKTIDGFVKRGTRAKFDISDERIEWRSRMHKDNLESKFLFALDGQEPIYGAKDNYLYVGLNRVVAGTFRNGSGLCEVVISLYSYTGK